MQCPVCHAENDRFAVVCTACRAFLQNRVPNLDLFSTAWQVIEQPAEAFRRITLAEHKNYAFLLYALAGIGVSFTGMSVVRAGERVDSLLEVLFWGLLIGIPAGVILAPLVSVIHWGLARMAGGRSTFRVSLGVSAYALVPVVLSVLLVLPVEVLTFGMYLFTHNPSPMTIKPVLYLVLLGFDGALVLWSLVLLAVGTSVGHQVPAFRSAFLAGVLGGGVLAGLYAAAVAAVRAF